MPVYFPSCYWQILAKCQLCVCPKTLFAYLYCYFELCEGKGVCDIVCQGVCVEMTGEIGTYKLYCVVVDVWCPLSDDLVTIRRVQEDCPLSYNEQTCIVM